MSNLFYFVVTVLVSIAIFMDSLYYKKSIISMLRVSFNIVYRRKLKLPPRSSASTMCAVNHIGSFEILVRQRRVSFIKRLKVSNHCLY